MTVKKESPMSSKLRWIMLMLQGLWLRDAYRSGAPAESGNIT